MTDQDGAAWYAVRCIFRCGWPPKFAGRAYEERITLWRAESFDQAIERAEAEAREYAASIIDAPDAYLSLAQAYRLSDVPADGAEVLPGAGEQAQAQGIPRAVLRHRQGASTTLVRGRALCRIWLLWIQGALGGDGAAG
jgi:hypothetical protein